MSWLAAAKASSTDWLLGLRLGGGEFPVQPLQFVRAVADALSSVSLVAVSASRRPPAPTRPCMSSRRPPSGIAAERISMTRVDGNRRTRTGRRSLEQQIDARRHWKSSPTPSP